MAKRRTAERTRRELLSATFKQSYHKGFRAASLGDILRDTKVTKGALYHHFDSKRAMGHAMVEEVLGAVIQRTWIDPLRDATDPLTRLQEIMAATFGRLSRRDIELGCPLNNLALEMSPIDEDFRRRLDEVYALWVDGIAEALTGGREAGMVRKDIDPARTAAFIVGAIAGARAMAKTARSAEVLTGCADSLRQYLAFLRPDGAG